MVARAKLSAINSVANPSAAEPLRSECGQASYEEFITSKLGEKKRELIGVVVGTLCTGVLSYFGGYATAILSVATLMLTGSTFLAFMVYFIGIVATIAGAMLVGARVQRVIVDGSLDRNLTAARHAVVAKTSVWYDNASSYTTGLFNRKVAVAS